MDAFITRRGGAGGGLNFRVVGGTAQPENPKENTIWVNTETEITGWIFRAEKPQISEDGFVWIKTCDVGDAQFNALKKDGIIVYPLFAKQYTNGTWNDKDAKIYQDEKWKDWVFYLYKSGNQYESITGGWRKIYTSANGWWYEGSVSFTDAGIVLNNTAAQMQSAAITSKKINLTNVDRVLVNHTKDRGSMAMRLYITSDTAYTDSPAAGGAMAESGIIDVPVSSLSGDYYIKVEMVSNTESGQHTVKEVYLVYDTAVS